MNDLLLTSNGDISFKSINDYNNTLKISFFKSKIKGLKIDFYIEKAPQPIRSKNSLMISFNYNTIKNNKIAMEVNKEAALIQLLSIKLKTSLGELPERKNIGSKLETIIHEDLYDKAVIKNVENIIYNCIRDLIEEPQIIIEPKIIKTNGYEQILNIKILDDNKLLYSYETEW